MGTFTLLKKKVAGHFHFGQSDTFPGKPASGKKCHSSFMAFWIFVQILELFY